MSLQSFNLDGHRADLNDSAHRISMTVPLDRTGEQDVTSLDYYHARFRAVEPEMGLNITDGGTNTLPYLFSWVS